AISQTKRREEAMKGYEKLLAHSDMSREGRDGFRLKLDKAKEQHEAWAERSQTLRAVVKNAECHDPDDLVHQFEADAEMVEMNSWAIWDGGKTPDENGNYVSFKQEDPACKLPFKSLDRSNIPATPDALVNDGVGLEVFLKHARDKEHKYPTHALGQQDGPAIMSYGSAIDMFDAPIGPGEDRQQESKSIIKPSVEKSMAQYTIADEPKPRTERDFRLQSRLYPTTEPILSDDAQWDLFKENKFMGDTAILVRQYAKLTEQKARNDKKVQERDTKSDPSGESLSADSVAPEHSTDTTIDIGEWPPVENRDFAGLTNWLQRCKKTDKAFGLQTMKKWKEERQKREAVTKELGNWIPKTSDNDLGSPPDPTKYFPVDMSLTEIDAKKLGIKLENKRR
ncbi:MAG: hypothetical protein Q9227_008242, partial [Pyrenula ochraceoflavens]